MKEGASAIRTLPPYDRNPRDTGCAASPRGSLQTFTLLQFAEIAVGADFQLAYGRLVGDDDACGMNLQRRDRPLVRVAPLDTVFQRAGLLVMMTSCESMIVATPTDMACLGTLFTSLSKNRELTATVSGVSVITRVRDTSDE